METTLYIKEPVSEIEIPKPVVGGQQAGMPSRGMDIIVFDRHGVMTFATIDKYTKRIYVEWNGRSLSGKERDITDHVTHFLKPVSVSEVPDEKEIAKIGFENYGLLNQQLAYCDGAKFMRDQLLPHFALLKEENEKQAEKIRKETDFVEQLKDAIEVEKEENKKLKERVAELEGMAKKYIELFESSDMRPEDECHELYNQMKNIYTHPHPNV